MDKMIGKVLTALGEDPDNPNKDTLAMLRELFGWAEKDRHIPKVLTHVQPEQQETVIEPLKCGGCNAPHNPSTSRCPYCGGFFNVQRPAEGQEAGGAPEIPMQAYMGLTIEQIDRISKGEIPIRDLYMGMR